MIVVGIDPSLSATGVAWYNGTLHGTCTIRSKPAPGLRGRCNRYHGLLERVLGYVAAQCPVAIFIEGYSYGSKGRSVYQIAEFGGYLRQWLINNYENVFEVPPTVIKKYATGRGNATKEDMIGMLEDYDVTNDNEADALHLAMLGWDTVHGAFMLMGQSDHKKESCATVEQLMEEERATWS